MTRTVYAVTNRRWSKGRFRGKAAADGELGYVISNGGGPGLGSEDAEGSHKPFDKVPGPTFRRRLIDDLRARGEAHERPIVVMPVHGYNNGWDSSAAWIDMIDDKVTSQVPGAVTVGFTWPSGGNVADYIGDRLRARASAIPFTGALSKALRLMQDEHCPAEIVVIAHSMGNYMMSKAVQYASEVHGDPAIHVFAETLMVAADVDAQCFEPGNVSEHLARFSRRVTCYRSVHDAAILASRAKRANFTGPRLGRQGIRRWEHVPPNVVQVDASAQTGDVGGIKSHSDHFHSPLVLADMIAVVKGVDRGAIPNRRAAVGFGQEFEIRPERGSLKGEEVDADT